MYSVDQELQQFSLLKKGSVFFCEIAGGFHGLLAAAGLVLLKL